jgi:hypothetical protein
MISGVDSRGRSVACFLFPTGRPRGSEPAQPSVRVAKSVRLDRQDAPDFITRLARLARGMRSVDHVVPHCCHANKEGLSCLQQQS